MAKVNQAHLKRLLRYNPNSGLFHWRASGRQAGTVNKAGYCSIMIEQIGYRAHRLAWLYVYGHFPVGGMDHKNRVKLDNRIVNLRPANQSQNSGNKKVSKNSVVGLKGVKQAHKKWMARIMLDGKHMYLGVFDTPEAAHAAYCKMAKQLHGEFFYNGRDG